MPSSAIADYCETIIATPPSGWPVRKLLNQFNRYFVAYMLIHNYFGWRAGAAPLPTLSRLKTVAVLSPRHVTNFAGVLKSAGLIAADPVDGDRRLAVLRPDDLLVQEIGRSLIAFLHAHDSVSGSDLAPKIAGSTEWLGHLIYLSGCKVLKHGLMLSPYPTIVTMTRFDCGYPTLAALMAAHYRKAEGRPTISLALEALAQRFQVSKSHIGNVLSHLDAKGLLDQDSIPNPALVAEFEQWCAAEMAHYSSLAELLDMQNPQ